MLSDFWFDTFAPTHLPLSQGSYNDNTAFTNLPHASKVCLSVTMETPHAQPIQTCVY